MSQNAARQLVPVEAAPSEPVVRDLKASLRLIRHGKIQGWVDAMMASGPTPMDLEQRMTWEERHRATAEKRYSENGQ